MFKKIHALFPFAVLCSLANVSTAHAESFRNYRLKSQTVDSAHRWELAYLALSAIDAGQTISCLEKGTCQEANPLFGKRPSTAKVIAFKLGGGLLHYALFKRAAKVNPKMALRAAQVSATLQAGVVGLNAKFVF